MDLCLRRCSSAIRSQGSNPPRISNRPSQILLRYAEESWSGLQSTIGAQAWLQITARPHPYLSHANDHVRSYLLSRIKSVDSDIEIVNDLNSTVVYTPRPGAGAYFEGTNILAKVPGSNKHDSNAVLFSAHYDSVSSAPGATDNGIGAVAALHLLEWVKRVPSCWNVLTISQQVPCEHASERAAP